MAVRIRFSGCLFSIIASIALTIALNLMLRGCSTFADESLSGTWTLDRAAIARAQLRKTNPVYDRITLAFTDDSAASRPRPGDPVVLQNGTLVETFDAKDGRRINRFSPAGGGKLLMDVTVTSPRLPSALRYRLVYRR